MLMTSLIFQKYVHINSAYAFLDRVMFVSLLHFYMDMYQ